jgi:hypothetical protein
VSRFTTTASCRYSPTMPTYVVSPALAFASMAIDCSRVSFEWCRLIAEPRVGEAAARVFFPASFVLKSFEAWRYNPVRWLGNRKIP